MNAGRARWPALALMVAALVACRRETERPAGPKFAERPAPVKKLHYRFAVHPLYNPAKLFEAYQPLVDYLNERLPGIHLTLEASRDYAQFEEKFRAGKPELLLPNPWQTLQAMKRGYRVIAMAGEAQDFRGIFVVRKDSNLRRPTDLKGKTVSYPSPTALAACIMPQYFLHRHGVRVTTDIENRYVGSQESSIMNAYLGKTAAGATWPPPWRAFQKDHPREAAEMKILWETEPLLSNSVMARGDLSMEQVEKARSLMLGLDGSTQGRAILAGMQTARFIPATDEDYQVVRRYVERFEAEVRPVELR